MTEVKPDRRTRYTQRVLKASLMELLHKKPIGKVTIKELCENADVNRSSFYTYYQDPYQLLQRIEDEIIEELNDKLAHFHIQSESHEVLLILEEVFRYIAENSSSCQLLLSEQGDVAFQKRVMGIAQQQYVREWKDLKEMEPEMAEYLYLFEVNGSIGIVQNWLKTGMIKTPQEMAKMLLEVTNHGLSAFV